MGLPNSDTKPLYLGKNKVQGIMTQVMSVALKKDNLLKRHISGKEKEIMSLLTNTLSVSREPNLYSVY